MKLDIQETILGLLVLATCLGFASILVWLMGAYVDLAGHSFVGN